MRRTSSVVSASTPVSGTHWPKTPPDDNPVEPDEPNDPDTPDNPPSDDPTCSAENLDLCDETNCTTVAGHWYNDACNAEEEPEEPEETATSTPPIITLTQTSLTLTVGDTFNSSDYVTTTDPEGDTVTLYATSSVDTTTVGTYSVEYTAEDEHEMWAVPQTLSVIVEALAEPTCDSNNLNLCDETNCTTDATGHWYDNVCNSACQEFTFYLDNDLDIFGDINSPISACEVPDNYVTNSDDCDDSNANINPNATEVCDSGIDENCDGVDDVCPVPDPVE